MRISNHDEFYTPYNVIAEEMDKHVGFFTGKVIYLPCDDPRWSNFWLYFVRTYSVHKYKSLIATFYSPGRQAFVSEFNGYRVRRSVLCGDGNYLSAECRDLAVRSDIVIVNPPFFSAWRYSDLLLGIHKDFMQIIPRWALSGLAKRMLPSSLYISDGMSSPTEYLVPARFGYSSPSGKVLPSGDTLVKVDTAWASTVSFHNYSKFIIKERN